MIIFLSGPMSGLPLNNYPAFVAEADRLRALGLDVRNPAEGPECDTWEGYMRNAIRMMLPCDTIRFLPNWERSRGSLLEAHIAEQLGMRMIWPDEDVTP